MRLEHLQSINKARENRIAAVTVTALDGGASSLYLDGEAVDEVMVPAVQTALRTGKSAIVEIDDRPLFINVYLPPPRIVVIGAVHISQALAGMATLAGFDLSIIDPRSAFATPERFGQTALFADWPEDVLKDAPLDAYTALVAVTHDPKIDDFPLISALAADCFYVGALGSRKTHARRVERLSKAGLDEAAIARIRAPIGLDIRASSPAEIAVSILAEIIQTLRTRDVMGGRSV
ncbi:MULTISPECIES: XdhC family protein [unclassified Rhizobium]|uniref:XdhC family protein n=1 Tax=unclassified Rhizobium TaxID=2613769 RepID=UPI0007130CB4|nr:MULTISPECIES: XdhC family protein [unclassified Rhizobium]KQS98226.1 XdhC/CoxF family protein [Rhizobium sp. Leaf386]KQT00490.1 XdhC/CoxF family protein [Rhizobium sp. Leaf391]